MIKLKNIYSNCYFLFVYQIKFVQSWCRGPEIYAMNALIHSLFDREIGQTLTFKWNDYECRECSATTLPMEGI